MGTVMLRSAQQAIHENQRPTNTRELATSNVRPKSHSGVRPKSHSADVDHRSRLPTLTVYQEWFVMLSTEVGQPPLTFAARWSSWA